MLVDEHEHPFIGRHVFAEIFGVHSFLLDDISRLNNLLEKAIELSHANIEGKLTKKFYPFGVSIIYLLSESHASIHTYPERSSLFFDAFTCGLQCNPETILDSFCNEIMPTKVQKKIIIREDYAEQKKLTVF